MDETNSKDGLTYSDRKVQINPGHPLYEWCSTVTSLSNNLYNASLFHIRQCMTDSKKRKNSVRTWKRKSSQGSIVHCL